MTEHKVENVTVSAISRNSNLKTEVLLLYCAFWQHKYIITFPFIDCQHIQDVPIYRLVLMFAVVHVVCYR